MNKNIIDNYGMKIKNRKTKKLINLETAHIYLKAGTHKVEDFEFDKKKLVYNPDVKRFWKRGKKKTEDYVKKINTTKKLQKIYKLKVNTPVKKIQETTLNKSKTNPWGLYGMREFNLSYSKGNPNRILQDIINFVNQYKARLGANAFRVFISANIGSGFYSGLIYTNLTINHFNQLQLDYPDFDIKQQNIVVKFYKKPVGAGCVKVSKWLSDKKKSVHLVLNDDGLCGQRCLMYGMFKDRHERNNLKKCPKKHDKLLSEICEYMGNQPLDITQFKAFTDANPKYRVVIISEFYHIVADTENEDYEEKIWLFYDCKLNHYHLITDVDAFINDKQGHYKWCHDCNKRFYKTTFQNHSCGKLVCKLCKTRFNNQLVYEEHKQLRYTSDPCPNCNCKCNGSECLENHILTCKGKNWFYPCCNKWGRTLDKHNHKCGWSWCKNCEAYLEDNHRCHIKAMEYKDNGLKPVVCFDFESWIDSDGNHQVSYICAIQRLISPSNQATASDEIHTWEGTNCLDDFINWILTHKKTTFIAHNGKAYDTWLIHYHLVRHQNKCPKDLIMAGQKIMYMKIDSNIFIDSINHFAVPLSAVPKTFGLDETQYKKGFYPYKFNTKENANYIGCMPPLSEFQPDSKKPKVRTELINWYNNRVAENNIWNHQQETREYCIDDVRILLEGCNQYSMLGYELTGIDPLSKQTIASWVLQIYLTNHYDDINSPIGVLNKEEYEFIKRAFHGGRTECIRLYRKWTEDEMEQGKYGRYVDIKSLYPTTQFYDPLPYDIPEFVDYHLDTEDAGILGGDLHDIINKNYGYFEVDIAMNKELFIAPLVNKTDGKLTADLVDKKKQVYFSEELKQAIRDGCIITKIHRCLMFKHTDTLFKSFVKKFLEVKENASKSPDMKQHELNKWKKFCQSEYSFTPQYKDKENSGLRSIAKLILNSLWGKFGQRPDMPTTEYIQPTQINKWWKLIGLDETGDISIKTDEITGDNLFVRYVDNREEKKHSLFKSNIGLAAAVTGNASMRLYKEMRLLGERVLYHDTDSIIYEYDKNLYNVPEGEGLGEWQSETGNNKICEYVSIAPKSYGYKVSDDKYSVKIGDVKMKGITLNYANHKVVNFDSMKSLVDGTQEKLITEENLVFQKTKTGIKTKTMCKDVHYTMDKRIRDGYWTYPKGHIMV